DLPGAREKISRGDPPCTVTLTLWKRRSASISAAHGCPSRHPARPEQIAGSPMLADAIRLLLFPALMAFAASSDLITMTISNRVSLALVASFFALAVMWHMPLAEIGMHVGA